MEQATRKTLPFSGTPRATAALIAIAILVFSATYGVLSRFGFVPDSTKAIAEEPSDAVLAGNTMPAEYPSRIVIPTLELDVRVANPTTAHSDVLDTELLKGAVRYPTSGLLGTDGTNVVIFAHSSYLPIVHNLAYKAFDGIQNMQAGEKVYVTGEDHVYVYAVDGVHKANTAEASIPLSVEGNKLTLITCDSFATKSDRYVVTATLVESYLNTTAKS